MSNLWFEKYRPRSMEDLIMSTQDLNKVKSWINDYKNGVKNTSCCLFLYGSPGVGKTTLAHCILKSANYEVVEMNASELRNAKNVKERVEELSGSVDITSIMCNKRRQIAIIMDEIDGMSSGDRGGIQEITDFIFKRSHGKSPFVCIANTVDKKLKTLRTKSVDLHIKEPNKMGLMKLAERVIQGENIDADPIVLQQIIKHSQCDYRRLINLMEYIWMNHTSNEKPIENIDSILKNYDKKHKHLNCYQTTEKLFNIPLTLEQSLLYFHQEPIMTHMLCCENAVTHILKNRKINENTKDVLFDLYNSYSEAQDFEVGIFKYQCWDLNEYVGNNSSFATNIALQKETEKFSVSRYQQLNYSSSMNKLSQESLQRKLRDGFKGRFTNHNNSQMCDEFTDIIVAKCVSGKWNEVCELLCHYKISYDDFEKKILKWSTLPFKSIITPEKKKHLKKILKNYVNVQDT